MNLNLYRIRTKSRLKKLSELLNNFFKYEDNQEMDSRVYFYLTSSDGLSILEIDVKEMTFRHASCDDFSNQFNHSGCHIDAASYLLELSRDQSRWEEFIEGINKKWSFNEYLKMRSSTK